jgi:hypothetical protein
VSLVKIEKPRRLWSEAMIALAVYSDRPLTT